MVPLHQFDDPHAVRRQGDARHGLAIQAMRAQCSGPADAQRLGITLNLSHVTPATPDPADVAAAARAE
ncbi:MAG TPA: hypothetical protein VK735_33085, partial [Pseudonocardia sp.]|uniref:hypothetical protein n=1 Tax=Pseudonocardia sp. TaxID=60912 RepID=UPI002C5531D1